MGITLEPSKGQIVLVDTSYFVFYRYFATFNWYRRQTEGNLVDVSSILANTDFMDKFAKMFRKALVDIAKKYHVTHASNMVLVRDCSRDKIWRHQFYNAYKATRDEKSQTFNKDVFVYTYTTLLPLLQAELGFTMIGHPCLEADDSIAIICKHVLDVSVHASMVIITNDNDYIQLLNHSALHHGDGTCQLQIVNLQDKNICERVGCPPDQYILLKKILGDKSDNIPPITKKCGEKTALKLSANAELLSTLLQSNAMAKQQFELNELLIDFERIPTQYCHELMCHVHVEMA